MSSGECSSTTGSTHSTKVMIKGVLVEFPCKPYQSQMQMMFKIISALEKKDNALLESPTGTGKTLALLCSSLAWLQREKAKLNAALGVDLNGHPLGAAKDGETEKSVSMECTCVCHKKKEGDTLVTDNQIPNPITLEQNPNPPTLQGHIPNPPIIQERIPNPAIQEHWSGQEPDSKCINKEATTKVDENPSVANGVDGTIATKLKPQAIAMEKETTPKESEVVTMDTETVVKEEPSESEKGKGRKPSVEKDDFAPPKKKFRHPGVGTRGKKKKPKGVVYDDVDLCSTQSVDHTLQPNSQGFPTWRMEIKSELSDSSNQHSLTMPGTASGDVGKDDTPCMKCDCHSEKKKLELLHEQETVQILKEKSSNAKLPKIFFATRTHKQIRQIVHEMKRTVYKDVPMCILASREHYCIHPEVSTGKNKNDECKKLLEYSSASCAFYSLYKRLGTQANLKNSGLTEAWDVEDLIRTGKQQRACPYFVSRSVMEEADIVFCPYNYIVDPGIRLSMSLSVEEDILIFDEGHNMEDAAREAASYTVNSFELLDVLGDIERVKGLLKQAEEVGYLRNNPQIVQLQKSYGVLRGMVHSVSKWISSQIPNLSHRGYESSCQIWYGNEMMKELEMRMGITSETYGMYRDNLHVIQSSKIDVQEDRRVMNFFSGEFPTMTNAMLKIVEHLLLAIGFMFQDNKKYTEDYRVALSTVTVFTPKGDSRRPGWVPRRARRETEKVLGHALSFWCMNPAVAFSELSSSRCIILTSGTLSPMKSFSSELGVMFTHQLEANHVIFPSQVLVQSVSHGPNGKLLLANYQTSESFEFQDDLGCLIAEVCECVPYGVLCFLPSYKMLDKLTQRWKNTGLFHRLEKSKTVLMEPRATDKSDFNTIIAQYYCANMGNTGDGDSEDEADVVRPQGALFIAVCRGKVSEGLDFADDNARAVITVGIPFPNVRDKQVELKREYNDRYSHSRDLLPGGEWYEIQAFRAVNQALGRCIRHRSDWGCLILVDDRFGKGGKYTNGLSKWVRKQLHHEPAFRTALDKMKSFISNRASSPCVQSLDVSVANSTIVAMDTSTIDQMEPNSVLLPPTPAGDWTHSSSHHPTHTYNLTSTLSSEAVQPTLVSRIQPSAILSTGIQDTTNIQSTSTRQSTSTFQSTTAHQSTSTLQSTTALQPTSAHQSTSALQPTSTLQPTSAHQSTSALQPTSTLQSTSALQPTSTLQSTTALQPTSAHQSNSTLQSTTTPPSTTTPSPKVHPTSVGFLNASPVIKPSDMSISSFINQMKAPGSAHRVSSTPPNTHWSSGGYTGSRTVLKQGLETTLTTSPPVPQTPSALTPQTVHTPLYNVPHIVTSDHCRVSCTGKQLHDVTRSCCVSTHCSVSGDDESPILFTSSVLDHISLLRQPSNSRDATKPPLTSGSLVSVPSTLVPFGVGSPDLLVESNHTRINNTAESVIGVMTTTSVNLNLGGLNSGDPGVVDLGAGDPGVVDLGAGDPGVFDLGAGDPSVVERVTSETDERKCQDEGDQSASHPVRTRRKNTRYARRKTKVGSISVSTDTIPEDRTSEEKTSNVDALLCTECATFLYQPQTKGRSVTVREYLCPVYEESVEESEIFSPILHKPVTIARSEIFWRNANVQPCSLVQWDEVLGLCVRGLSCKMCGANSGMEILAGNREETVLRYASNVLIW